MRKPRQRVDWDAIEPHYRANVRSLRDIGAEFGVSDAAIVKHAEKFGWERDLGARIKAKADAKVAAALVRAERAEQPEAKLTEAVRVEVEAEVQARVRQSHRTDINRSKRIANLLLEKLEKDVELTKPTLAIKEATAILKQLIDGQKTLVSMEREAYGIAQLQEDMADKPPMDPVQGAKALAFILARAGALVSKETA